jgi:hypothetical protein
MSDTVIAQPAVSSLSGNAASYQNGGAKGSKGTKKRTTSKKGKKSLKRKSAKKCWWKFF